MASRILSCLGIVLSWLKYLQYLISYSLEEFALKSESDSTPLLLMEPLIVFAISLSMGFTFSLPSKTFIISKSGPHVHLSRPSGFRFLSHCMALKFLRETFVRTVVLPVSQITSGPRVLLRNFCSHPCCSFSIPLTI